jgi:hypothetical protein
MKELSVLCVALIKASHIVELSFPLVLFPVVFRCHSSRQTIIRAVDEDNGEVHRKSYPSLLDFAGGFGSNP